MIATNSILGFSKTESGTLAKGCNVSPPFCVNEGKNMCVCVCVYTHTYTRIYIFLKFQYY